MSKAHVVYYPAHERPLQPQEIEAEFAKLGRNDGLWLAIMQVLQERLANATSDAANGEAHAAGRLQEILSLAQQFSAYRKGREARGKT
jgi:hypothetical protein